MNPEILKKILQYAPEPPAKVWEGISKALDEQDSGSLAEKFKNYQAAPPADTWSRIEKDLDKPSIPLHQKERTRFFTLPRMAAAAAIIIIATASLLFWNLDEEKEFAITENKTSPVLPSKQPQTKTDDPAQNSVQANEDGNHVKGTIAINNPSSLPAKYNLTGKTSKRKRSSSREDANETMLSFIPRQAEEKAIVASSTQLDKYMVYSDDDGKAMKLSKKLFDLISCVKEELICQQQVQQIQSKFASYMTTNDFPGLMEMLRNLRENQ